MIAGTGWMPFVGQIEEKIDELNPSIAEERVELVVVFCAEKPRLAELLIESGVYLQLIWGSFVGRYGRRVASSARKMAAKGWIHCLATDTHDAGGIDAGDLRAVDEILKNMIGPDNLRRLAFEDPRRISRGAMPRPLVKTDLTSRRRKARSWWFWKNRGNGGQLNSSEP